MATDPNLEWRSPRLAANPSTTGRRLFLPEDGVKYRSKLACSCDRYSQNERSRPSDHRCQRCVCKSLRRRFRGDAGPVFSDLFCAERGNKGIVLCVQTADTIDRMEIQRHLDVATMQPVTERLGIGVLIWAPAVTAPAKLVPIHINDHD